MPKSSRQATTPVAWLALAVLAGGLVYAAVSSPAVALIALVVICAAFLVTRREAKREGDALRRLAEAREGESICAFARDFDTRAVDTWVVRAVYEQVQANLSHVHPAFPVRASDRLKEDLHFDEDDLDIDIATQVAQRTGRDLDQSDLNPLFGKVKTVRDLVMFFQAQPRRSAA